MFQKIRDFVSFWGRRSFDTQLWSISVIGGAIILVMSFFVGPTEREIALGQNDNRVPNVTAIIEYSSVMGSISSMDNVDAACAAAITDAIPDYSSSGVSLDDYPTEDVAEDEDLLMPGKVANDVAATFEGLSSASASSTDNVICVGQRYDLEEVELLESLVECEAMSEDEEGKLLVANVVLNRKEVGDWGDTLEDVITSPGQFEPVIRGSIKSVNISPETVKACMRALNGENISEGALYFRKSNSLENWGNKKFLFKYGSHAFYK